jgi:hypothetical protein
MPGAFTVSCIQLTALDDAQQVTMAEGLGCGVVMDPCTHRRSNGGA